MGISTACPGCGEIEQHAEIEKVQNFSILCCRHCSLEFAHPMKNPGGDWYDRAYALRHSAIDSRIREYYRWAIARLPKQGRLLDIGCGEGVFVAYARRNGIDAYGVDFSKEAINLGRRWYGLTTIYDYTLSDLKQTDALKQFDMITLFEVLEHQERPIDFVVELRSILRDGGLLVASVPYRNQWPVRDFGDYPPNHLTRWTEKSLRTLFESRGFSGLHIERSSRLGSYHNFLGYLTRKIVYGLFGMHAVGLNSENKTFREKLLKTNIIKRYFSLLRPRQVRDILLWPFAVLTFPLMFPWFQGSNLMIIATKCTQQDH